MSSGPRCLRLGAGPAMPKCSSTARSRSATGSADNHSSSSWPRMFGDCTRPCAVTRSCCSAQIVTLEATHRAIHAVFRIESPRLIAGLTRLVKDLGLAEELAQDALVTALERWPDA